MRNERMGEMLRLFDRSHKYVDQTPGRNGIDGRQHALRCAALGQERGLIPELGFIGLVHDLARPLNDVHHGEIMAEMVRDRVSEDAYEILRTHGQFQSVIVHRETEFPYVDRTWFRAAQQLAGFEVLSFQNGYSGPEMTRPEAIALMKRYLD